MEEMKNICGKIPMDLHEKVREEIELTESSTQKFLQQVIEEHFNRLEGKGEISMGAVRTGNKGGLRKLDISLLRQLGGQMRLDHQNSLPMAQV